MVVSHQCITLTIDICVLHGGREALRCMVCQWQWRLVSKVSSLANSWRKKNLQPIFWGGFLAG